MAGFMKRRTYTETVEGRRRFLSRIKYFILFLLCFELLVGVFVTSYSVGSSSMSPAIVSGDRIVTSPLVFGPLTIFGKVPGIARPARGDIVLVDAPFSTHLGFFESIADGLLRFVSIQRLTLASRHDPHRLTGPFLERVIATPGDELYMEDFIFMVRPSGTEHFFTEFELSDRRYDIAKPKQPEGWKPEYPFSGSMKKLLLAKDEYFVAGDDRASTGDSRYWGPIRSGRLRANLLFRYWPLGRFGAP